MRIKHYLALAAVLAIAGSAEAVLLAYEGFEYPTTSTGLWSGTGNTGLNGGSGFASEWIVTDTTGTPYWNIVSGSPTWGALTVSSNQLSRIETTGTEEMSRPVSADLDGASDLWFSMLWRGGDNAAFAIGGAPFTSDTSTALSSGPGFGFLNRDYNLPVTDKGIRVAVWNDSGAVTASGDLGLSRGDTVFLVGHISFNTGTAGADVYKLYSVGVDLELANATLIATLEVDGDESLLDTVAKNTNRNPGMDELRIGTAYADVVAASAEFIFNLLPEDQQVISADFPAVTATNSIQVEYDNHVSGVEITALNLSDTNAFSVLTATPFTMTDPIPSNALLEFAFDATAVTNITGASEGFNATGSVDIVWTKVGSGVSNTNAVELIGDFNNPLTRFNYDNTLALGLAYPATAVTNDISVSYVAGRPGHTNVQITAINVVNASTNGFSVLTAPFTIPDAEPSNSVIQVTFDNSGGQLENKDSATADILITWQEAGGTTNYTVTSSVSVTYLNLPQGVIQQVFSIPSNVETFGDGKLQLNNFALATNKWIGANLEQKVNDGYLWVKSGGNNRSTVNLIEGGTRGMDNFGPQDTMVLSNGLYRYDFDFEMTRTPNTENMWGFGAYALIGQDAYDTNSMVNYVEFDLGTDNPVYVEPENVGSAYTRVHPNGKLIGSNLIARTTGSVYLNIQDGEDAVFVIQSGGNAEPYIYELTLTRVGDFDPNTDIPNSPDAVLAADFNDIDATNSIVMWVQTDSNQSIDSNGVAIANTWRGSNVIWENQKFRTITGAGTIKASTLVLRRGESGYDDVGVQDTIALTSGVYSLTLDLDVVDTFQTNTSVASVEVYALSQDLTGDVNQVRIKHTPGDNPYLVADGSAAFALLGKVDYSNNVSGEAVSLTDMQVLDDQDVVILFHHREGPDMIVDNVELVRTGDAVLTGYDGWAAGFTGFFDTALESDPDSDGVNNLIEYALNGDPTDPDTSILPDSFTDVDGGSNWLYYVHTERTDDDTLTYTVEAGDNLVYTNWNVAGISFVGDSETVDSYKSVTNRTDTDVSAEFIRLQVEKD
ncbi:hypothetical protein [Pontiella sulfatireligans]|uniref:Uncharacterized protein n=1 Tax=Pontiella sulfatireligans TaxID=2750658 RepID=A0A6C2UI65_9BACT|nr:hypothetical protein [Pontiella sulfatireligans]VGO19649.1 hypothetical protein SCARR_01708 [Pontiella sulfatireligans]